MTTTTHPEFNGKTEAVEVAKAFPDSIRGKSILITGVNRKGIGFATAQAFASQAPAHLIITGRQLVRLQESIDGLRKDYPDVDYRPLVVDLSIQKSVRAAAEEILLWNDVPVINILVNNAGTGFYPTRDITEDGIELNFATNHIGHFLLTNLLQPKLIKAAATSPRGFTRVINVSSGAAMSSGIRWSDINFGKKSSDLPPEEQPNYKVLEMFGISDAHDKTYISNEAYAQSKAANVLFGIGLTKRVYDRYGILSISVHPGVIHTELERHMSQEEQEHLRTMLSRGSLTLKLPTNGASTSLVAATDPSLGPPGTKDGHTNYGAYLIDCQVSIRAHPRASSSSEAEKLWALSEDLVHQKFPW